MPQFPCVSDSGQKKKKEKKVCKKKKGGKKKCKTKKRKPDGATHTEIVRFLNKKKQYNAVSLISIYLIFNNFNSDGQKRHQIGCMLFR